MCFHGVTTRQVANSFAAPTVDVFVQTVVFFLFVFGCVFLQQMKPTKYQEREDALISLTVRSVRLTLFFAEVMKLPPPSPCVFSHHSLLGFNLFQAISVSCEILAPYIHLTRKKLKWRSLTKVFGNHLPLR